ncbi:MAG: hypothetical protein IKY83_14980, partial [Proteobacteria bacterium]|nr:hypothetical protein [Pseudomonadota bacterium]
MPDGILAGPGIGIWETRPLDIGSKLWGAAFALGIAGAEFIGRMPEKSPEGMEGIEGAEFIGRMAEKSPEGIEGAKPLDIGLNVGGAAFGSGRPFMPICE